MRDDRKGTGSRIGVRDDEDPMRDDKTQGHPRTIDCHPGLDPGSSLRAIAQQLMNALDPGSESGMTHTQSGMTDGRLDAGAEFGWNWSPFEPVS